MVLIAKLVHEVNCFRIGWSAEKAEHCEPPGAWWEAEMCRWTSARSTIRLLVRLLLYGETRLPGCIMV